MTLVTKNNNIDNLNQSKTNNQVNILQSHRFSLNLQEKHFLQLMRLKYTRLKLNLGIITTSLVSHQISDHSVIAEVARKFFFKFTLLLHYKNKPLMNKRSI